VDNRAETFRRKFKDAGKCLGALPHEIVSMKVRETVTSYSEYHEFLRALEHQAGMRSSPVSGDLQGKSYLISDGSSKIIFVEHESGLEILYIAGSIASLVGLVPMVLQGWRAFRGRHHGRHDFENGSIEIRHVDEKGKLLERHVHDDIGFGSSPFVINAALASAARIAEEDLSRLRQEIASLTHRVEMLEKEANGAARLRKPAARKKK